MFFIISKPKKASIKIDFFYVSDNNVSFDLRSHSRKTVVCFKKSLEPFDRRRFSLLESSAAISIMLLISPKKARVS